MHRRRALAVGAAMATATAAFLVPTSPASAAPAAARPLAPSTARTAQPAPSDVKEIPQGKHYPLAPGMSPGAQQRTATTAAAGVTPAVGTVRQWIALDDYHGTLYRKDYTLTAVGAKIEVWVASATDAVSTGTAFPAGDCRNSTPGSTLITTKQAQDLADQFDHNIYPKEAAAFSVAPDRDGSKAQISGDYSGSGDKTVTLVDNVRDDNFFNFPAAPTYVAGFFSSQFNELLDRNVMTIDAFDWKHRTGANPVDEPTADLCSSRPARPRLYEGVFAHEYQHLLQYYQDPSEVNFINEGLSDFAQTLVGYVNTSLHVDQKGADSHIYCFQGFGTTRTAYNPNPRDCGGPQNSLTLWGDEGSGNEILADYGNAYSFQVFLNDYYGQAFTSALHRDGRHQGLAGVQAQLDVFKPGKKVRDLLHDFQVTNLLDRYLGTPAGGTVTGRSLGSVTTPGLSATVNLLNPASYAKPGAAPNGADYVGLRGSGATFLRGDELQAVQFVGAKQLPALPLLWTSVQDAPGRTGNATLWSGNSSNLDATAVIPVTVPTANPTLTYTEKHLAEATYDYAYTVVSTDGGRTYTPLANAHTVQGPLGPALNGDAAAFATQTFDLSAYAGKSVLLGFRYVSDGGTNDGGWYVDDVRVGGTTLATGTTAGFRSPTQIRPTQVANWHLQIVGLDTAARKAHVLTYDRDRLTVLPRDLQALSAYPLVVAIVAYDEPTEQVQQYAPYTLTVNGVTQPGGA